MNKIRCQVCKKWYKMRKGEHRYDGKPKLCDFCLKTAKLNK